MNGRMLSVARASSPASSSGVSPCERAPKRGARRPANSQARTPALQMALNRYRSIGANTARVINALLFVCFLLQDVFLLQA